MKKVPELDFIAKETINFLANKDLTINELDYVMDMAKHIVKVETKIKAIN